MNALSQQATSRQQEIINLMKTVFEIHREELRNLRIILFGSRVDGTAQDRSDFDIGILPQGELDIRTKFFIEDLLEELPTLLKFDVVNLDTAPNRFRQRALRQYEVIFE